MTALALPPLPPKVLPQFIPPQLWTESKSMPASAKFPEALEEAISPKLDGDARPKSGSALGDPGLAAPGKAVQRLLTRTAPQESAGRAGAMPEPGTVVPFVGLDTAPALPQADHASLASTAMQSPTAPDAADHVIHSEIAVQQAGSPVPQSIDGKERASSEVRSLQTQPGRPLKAAEQHARESTRAVDRLLTHPVPKPDGDQGEAVPALRAAPNGGSEWEQEVRTSEPEPPADAPKAIADGLQTRPAPKGNGDAGLALPPHREAAAPGEVFRIGPSPKESGEHDPSVSGGRTPETQAPTDVPRPLADGAGTRPAPKEKTDAASGKHEGAASEVRAPEAQAPVERPTAPADRPVMHPASAEKADVGQALPETRGDASCSGSLPLRAAPRESGRATEVRTPEIQPTGRIPAGPVDGAVDNPGESKAFSEVPTSPDGGRPVGPSALPTLAAPIASGGKRVVTEVRAYAMQTPAAEAEQPLTPRPRREGAQPEPPEDSRRVAFPQTPGPDRVAPGTRAGETAPLATPELAFADRLARILQSPERESNLSPNAPVSPETGAAPKSAQGELAFATRLAPAGATEPTSNPIRHGSQDSDKPARRIGEAAAAPAKDSAVILHQDGSPRVTAVADAPAPRSASDAPKAETPQARPAAPAEPPADAPKPTAAAHEIRVQVNGGEQRVELRMVERGGDVHVAVRTSDARLAGALREDLPSLSARLEQTGFHAENWHTGAAALSRQAAADFAAGGSAQEQHHSPGQDSREQQQDRQHEKQPENPQRKNDRKDFAWLFTSLR